MDNENKNEEQFFNEVNKEILDNSFLVLSVEDYSLAVAKRGVSIDIPCYILVNNTTHVIEFETQIFGHAMDNIVKIQDLLNMTRQTLVDTYGLVIDGEESDDDSPPPDNVIPFKKLH